MPRTANKFPKTITVRLETWMHAAIVEAALANDRTPEQEIRARLREGLQPPAVEQVSNGPVTGKMSLGD
jgi:hypothetical protein